MKTIKEYNLIYVCQCSSHLLFSLYKWRQEHLSVQTIKRWLALTWRCPRFRSAFGNYAKRLYAFGFKYLRSKEDAEGLVQDVFLKIWENRKKLDKDSSFKSYLFTIAYNDICSIFRKRVTKRGFHNEFAERRESRSIVGRSNTKLQVSRNIGNHSQ